MKTLKTIMILAFATTLMIFLSGAAKPKKGEKKAEIPKSGIFYSQDFEEEDNGDAWSSDPNELEWSAKGANGSKGCVKVSNPAFDKKKSGNITEDPALGFLEAEKYIEFVDKNTTVEFDYFAHGVGDKIYFRGISLKRGFNVFVKDPVKEKWAHAVVKIADGIDKDGGSGAERTYRSSVYMFCGVDKNVKDPYVLIDNVKISVKK